MTRVVDVTPQELLERRAALLERHAMTLDEFSAKAETFQLTGEEWQAWDDLKEIAFLLGE